MELVTLGQLAKALGLSRNWLRAEVMQGRLPCLRAGRRILLCRSAVEARLAERAASGDSQSDTTGTT
jgi:excisionase family DNA binding protein